MAKDNSISNFFFRFLNNPIAKYTAFFNPRIPPVTEKKYKRAPGHKHSQTPPPKEIIPRISNKIMHVK